MSSEDQKLSVLDAAVVVVGIVFGSGIFVAPQLVAAFCGSIGLSLLAWPTGALIAMCGSLCYAECISRVRAEGGFYSVFRHTFGDAFASTAGLVSQLVISPAALAGPVTIGGGALAALLFGPGQKTLACTLALLLLVALLNINGVRFSKSAQRVFVASKVLLVSFLLLACLFSRARPVASAGLAAADWAPTTPGAYALLAPFFGILLWTFDGWTDVTLISGRLNHPGRDLSRALVLGLFSLAAIFMAVQAAVMLILGAAGTAASEQPFAAAIAAVFGPDSAPWVNAAIILSTFTSAHGVMWMVSSLTRVMSETGALPPQLARVDAALGRPALCVAFVALLSGGACLLDSFAIIVALFSFFIWVFYGLMALSLLKLRRAGPPGPGVWVAPGGMVPPLIVGAVATLMTLSHLLTYPRTCALAVLFFASVLAARVLRTQQRLRSLARSPSGA